MENPAPIGQLAPLDGLIDAARFVGVRIARHPAGDIQAGIEHQLYAWVTPEEGVVYLGKSESAKRVRDEIRMVKNYDPSTLVDGFVLLMLRHGARPVPLDHEGLDPYTALQVLDRGEWGRSAIDHLREYLGSPRTWGTSDFEYFLIRTAVNGGYMLGNSSGAGQWGPAFDARDYLAAIAAVDCAALSVPEAAGSMKRQLAGTQSPDQPRMS